MKRYLPGVILCCVVSLASVAGADLEQALFGRVWLEALVLAILLGALVRHLWVPGARFVPGIVFCGKYMLEVAVMLLGATISGATLMAAGPGLLGGIALTVMLAIMISYTIGRRLGLTSSMALLVACGNSICGNSAIAAVAPVIGASGEDVAASIGFTAVLGVGVVLGIPVMAGLLHLAGVQSGILAGLMVYAVPQVLAATASLGSAAIQMGTLVKLVRVLMLGPVCVALALMERRPDQLGKLHWSRLVPWFIIGFVGLMALNNLGLLPVLVLKVTDRITGPLTIIAMAALGLGVEVRRVAGAGVKVTAAVVLSLGALAVMSVALIALLYHRV